MNMSTEKPLISVIVPIYNSASYLSTFIESVLNQSFADFELILINDGSTDCSGKICEEYSRTDNRIRVIHKANGGVSAARNSGIAIATGKWLYFCDSDDELLPNCLSILIDQTKNKDIILVEGDYIITNNNIEKRGFKISDRVIPLNDYWMLLFNPSDGRYHGYLWTKLFKQNIVKKFRLNFDEKIFYNEDRLFVFCYLCCVEGAIAIISKPIYNYYIRSTGAMQSINNGKYKLFRTDLDAFVKMYNLSCALHNPPLIQTIKYACYISYKTNVNLVRRYSDSPKEIIESLNKMINSVCYKWEIVKYSFRYKLGQLRHIIKI